MTEFETATQVRDHNRPSAGHGVGLCLNERQVARLISAAEAGRVEETTLEDVDVSPGRAQVLGVTGPPGSGKSTLVDVLASRIREDGLTVAILAVDPSSEQTGGAVLGDRVRMSRHSTDPGVYIRSMATRGSTHGLARATRDAVRIVEAAGYDVIIVETVGVGQVELDIVQLADTVAVLTIPGLGDTMQMNKAGIMEVGDVFVVNMADRPETNRTVRELRQALAIGRQHDSMPPICTTVATDGKGVPELWAALLGQHRALAASGELATRRLAHARAEFREIAQRRWLRVLDERLRSSPRFTEVMDDLDHWRTTPQAAASSLLADLDGGNS
jgi:LAO/AO transport system kinase